MTAIAVRDTQPPRRLGMKILAAVLTIVCIVQLLIAFEEVRTVAAVRAVRAGAPAERAGDWIGQSWSNLVRAVNPTPPVLAEPEDRLLTGHFVAAEALMSPDTATTVRMRNGKISATDGPFAELKEQVAGFILIEAADLNEAMRIGANIPLARIGSVEVRPVM